MTHTTTEETDHKRFFREHGESLIKVNTMGRWISDEPVTMEELYQIFKARLLEECTPPGVVIVEPD